MKRFVDYYSILGIGPVASAVEIRRSYLLLAKRHHPDTADDDKATASEKFRLIKEAYEVLSDADRRTRYDGETQRHMWSHTKANRVNRSGWKSARETQRWKRACRANPELERICGQLEQLEPSLAHDFKETLLYSNDFLQATTIATKLRADFLARYLDNAPQLLTFPEWIRNRF